MSYLFQRIQFVTIKWFLFSFSGTWGGRNFSWENHDVTFSIAINVWYILEIYFDKMWGDNRCWSKIMLRAYVCCSGVIVCWSSCNHVFFIRLLFKNVSFFVGSCLNTLRLEINGHLLQTTFWEVFSWMKTIVSWFIIHRSFFLWVQLKMTQYWFRWWLDVKQMAKHYVI